MSENEAIIPLKKSFILQSKGAHFTLLAALQAAQHGLYTSNLLPTPMQYCGTFIEVEITYIHNNFGVGDGEGKGGTGGGGEVGVMVPALQSHNYTIGEPIVPGSIPAVYDVPTVV